MSRVLPYLWYPLLFAGAIAAFAAMLAAGMTLVLATYLPILAAALVIVVLELRFPERLEWRPQGSDVAADAAFMAFVQILLARTLAVLVVFAIAEWMHEHAPNPWWPHDWPLGVVMLLAVDFMRYWVHRACHAYTPLWRLHEVHHSPDILYTLNVGRFHPLEKVLQFACDGMPFLLLGVAPEVIGGYFLLYAVNGFFQHSNLRLRYGWLNYVVGSAETHRWHHARDPRTACCNFGNTTIVWDLLFGTWYLPAAAPVDDIGIMDKAYPKGFWAQMLTPFRAPAPRRPRHSALPAAHGFRAGMAGCARRPRPDAHPERAEGQELPGHSHDLHRDISRQGTAAGWVLDHRQSRLRRNIEAEARLPGDEIMVAGGVRAYLCVPLMARGRALGALLLQSFAPNRYSPDDVPLLEEVAKQIALAVENMRAYEEIARLRAKLEEENRYLQEEIKSDHNFEEIVGQSRAIKEVFKTIEAVAPAGATVLITGETGTGKELVARALHNLSPRRGKALIKVNCAALPAGLIESELFGHEKGAFTGAIARKIGRFELAHGGTLFLDEIGDLPLELQPKLLRVLQEGEFERIGASHTTTVDVRVVAATNRDLETAVQGNRFRSDLYYRLNVFPIRLPPLRERTEDIPLLVRYLTLKYGPRLGKRISNVPPAVMEVLQTYSWPGNVRDLENVIERATILSAGAELDLGWWPMTAGGRGRAGGTRTLEEVERDHIRAVLELTGWRVSGERGAAGQLGIKPTTLEARMKKLGITRKE